MKREDMLIEAVELLTQRDDPKLRIFDATILFFRQQQGATAFEQYQQEHIPAAAFFDHQVVSDSSSPYMYMVLPAAELHAQLGEMGIAPDSQVVFYTSEMLPCASRAWWLLRYAGHDHVRVLNGGLAAWQEAGGAVETGVSVYPPTTFSGQLRPEMFASKDEVLAAMGDSTVCTLNTLTPEAYAKGHISGSALSPCGDLMHDMSAFIATEALASRLHEEAQHERVITYCGGGIAATVNAMAHLMTGNDRVAVYDGSMDEWQGEALPLASNESS